MSSPNRGRSVNSNGGSPNGKIGGSNSPRPFVGTILGLGTTGLGEAAGRATDKMIEEERFRTFWADWERTREQWGVGAAGRDQRIVNILKEDRDRRSKELHNQRVRDILQMQSERKQNKAVREKEKMEDAEGQRKVNADLNEIIRKEREEGIRRRHEGRMKELDELHREREILLEMNAVEREADKIAKQDQVDELRAWHQECKERAAAEAERRQEERNAAARKLKKEQKKRKELSESLHSAIELQKSMMAKDVAATHQNGKKAQQSATIGNINVARSMREEGARRRAEKAKAREKDDAEKTQYMTAMQARQAATRQQYEDTKREEKERMQVLVKEQKLASRRMQEEEALERKEEHAAHIANIRALINRKRIEGRSGTSMGYGSHSGAGISGRDSAMTV